jgi:hypothetical protein
MKVVKHVILPAGIILFVLMAVPIIIGIIIPAFKLEVEVNRLKMKILRENDNVKYVNIYVDEDFPPLTDAVLTIMFMNGEYFILFNVDEKQDEIRFKCFNGYVVAFFIHNYSGFPEYYTRKVFPGPEFYEDSLGITLRSVNDFIQFYPELKNYIDSLELITDEKIQDYGYDGLWRYLEESGLKTLSNENSGYDYFVVKEKELIYSRDLGFEMNLWRSKNRSVN